MNEWRRSGVVFWKVDLKGRKVGETESFWKGWETRSFFKRLEKRGHF